LHLCDGQTRAALNRLIDGFNDAFQEWPRDTKWNLFCDKRLIYLHLHLSLKPLMM
jgi:hypothetical protein